MASHQTIAAIASPPGTGALALIRISGAESLSISRALFPALPANPVPRRQYFGKCLDADGVAIDEVLLTLFPGPASFTGEDVVELSCHGGAIVTRTLLDRILELGAAPAEPGEFTQRAFLNGKLDLTQAEAVMDLISARSSLAAKAASQQLSGKLGERMEALRQGLIEVAAHLEAYIDFPDEDIDPESREAIESRITGAISGIDRMLETAERGRILREGVRTVLCGPPNAGKSSLLNQLVGFDRAIVSREPGTTRDTIEEFVSLDGIPLRLVDTAGIRDSSNEIEILGIHRSEAELEKAELILLIFDSSDRSHALESISLPEGPKVVRILNKTDLPRHDDWNGSDDFFPVSCETGEGLDRLRDHIVRLVTGREGGFAATDLVAVNARHQHHLRSAREKLETALGTLQAGESPEFVSFEIRDALESIGMIVGKTDIEEILGSIFSTFCVGK